MAILMWSFDDILGMLRDVYPLPPSITEESLPHLSGKVYIVTGGSDGIGLFTSKILVKAGAKVYIAARNEEKIKRVISEILEEYPNGRLSYFIVDYNDLSTIKSGAAKFLEQETRLDGIVHNAGMFNTERTAKTKQGFEPCLGVNGIAPHLLQKLLDGILIKTASISPSDSVRIVYVASSAHFYGPWNQGGIDWQDINSFNSWRFPLTIYGQSKTINIYDAALWHRYHKDPGADKIVAVSVHPGSIDSELTRQFNSTLRTIIKYLFVFETRYGAYSILYPLLSPLVTIEDNGKYFVPFGGIGTMRHDVQEEIDKKNGVGDKMWDFLETAVAPYI